MTNESEFWNRRREQLQAAVRKAVLDLFEHTGSNHFRLPLDPPHQKLWVSAGPEGEPSGSDAAKLDRAYCDGARAAQGIAHQSLVAMDDWIAKGCGNRQPAIVQGADFVLAEKSSERPLPAGFFRCGFCHAEAPEGRHVCGDEYSRAVRT